MDSREMEIIDQAKRESWTTLDLSGRGMVEIPDAIGELTRLQSVDLSDNQLTRLPAAVGQLTDLESLNLRDNQLTGLPAAIGQLTDLESLNLSDNELTELPEAIGRLSRLEWLNLSLNELTKLPEVIGHLTGLRSLDLSYNELREIPELVGRLTDLEALDLSQNSLTVFPDAVSKLIGLRSLDLSGNYDFEWNQLTEIPEAIGELTHLQSLVLVDVGLTKLPEAIGKLTGLRSLDLSRNDLTELPESFEQLLDLESLDLSANGLAKVPGAIGRLPHLKSLDLSFNRLPKRTVIWRKLQTPLESFGPLGLSALVLLAMSGIWFVYGLVVFLIAMFGWDISTSSSRDIVTYQQGYPLLSLAAAGFGAFIITSGWTVLLIVALVTDRANLPWWGPIGGVALMLIVLVGPAAAFAFGPTLADSVTIDNQKDLITVSREYIGRSSVKTISFAEIDTIVSEHLAPPSTSDAPGGGVEYYIETTGGGRFRLPFIRSELLKTIGEVTGEPVKCLTFRRGLLGAPAMPGEPSIEEQCPWVSSGW